MSRALIAYGTRFGATASTAEEMAKVLRAEGVEVKVSDVSTERPGSIDGFDLVIVGSGIMINRWVRGPERFLARFHRELAHKKVALFVCCGSAAEEEGKDGGPSVAEVGRRRYLEERAARHGLRPIAMGLFGGVYDYNKVPWYARKALEADRPRIESRFRPIAPDVYDTRDWDAIRAWAREVARAV